MTDIVKRLREHARVTPSRVSGVGLISEAADEIERLRAALKTADAACLSYWGWEYGRDGDDIPNASLLVAWRKDYEARALPKESNHD